MKLNTLCRRFNLKNSVRAPTRGANVLYQVLTNMLDFYDEVMYLPPVGRSGHQCLLFSPKIKQKVKLTSRKVHLTKPCNLAALGLKLNPEDWNLISIPGSWCQRKSPFFRKYPDKNARWDNPWDHHTGSRVWQAMDDGLYKGEIRARQKVYTTGNMTQYRHLADKIMTLIKRAKWHRSIFQLVGFGEANSNNL